MHKPKRGGFRKEALGKTGPKLQGESKRISFSTTIDPITKIEMDKLKASGQTKEWVYFME